MDIILLKIIKVRGINVLLNSKEICRAEGYENYIHEKCCKKNK
ncbi:hypothetical protein BD780_000826 [Clostridium tetanomorphum]|nr:hypothetical protein [Clostridium tetanomorphum]MBP1863503.1 hypothetical protein [Clostridium tetanomorphum]NRS83601.1 hypothetical protein [Clostridium tetanomorphum]